MPVFGTSSSIDGLDPEAAGRAPLAKRLVVGATVGLLALAAVYGFRRMTRADPVASSAGAASGSTSVDPARQALQEAKELAAQGDLDLAHARIASDVAKSPTLRDGPEVREIESRWADAVLARAEQELDMPTRRAMLNTVAQSTTVDAARRRAAADKLKEADYLGTDIHELPAAKAAPSSPAQGEPIAKTAPKPVLAPDPWIAPAAPAAPTQKPRPVTATSPVAAPPPAPTPPEAPASRANELALQGPEGEAKARAQLEARVANGRATPDDLRLLRAICKHMGDRGCSDRASALIAGQK